MGTPKPMETYTGNGSNAKDEYTRRLASIRSRDTSEPLPVDLPKGTLAHSELHNSSSIPSSNVAIAGGTSNSNSISYANNSNGNQNGYTKAVRPPTIPGMSMGNVPSGGMGGGMRLCLDFRKSLESKRDSVYVLRFPKIENLVGLQLNSCTCPSYRGLTEEASIGLRIENLPSRYANSNLFSRLYLEKETNFLHYRPEEDGALILTDTQSLSYLELSFRTWDDQPINLDLIDVDQIFKNSKNGTMKIVCRQPHNLTQGEAVSFQLDSKKAERLEVLRISDENTFVTGIPEKMEGQIQISRIYPRITLNFSTFNIQ